MSRTGYRRRKVIIHPSFQLGTALGVVFFLVLYSAILGFLIFYPMKAELERLSDSRLKLYLADQMLLLHSRLWPGVVAVALLVGGQIILVSHRIAGPLYRIRAALERLLSGNYSVRVKLRDRDRFREFEPIVNALAEKLEAERAKVERLVAAASRDDASIQEIRSLAVELVPGGRSKQSVS